MSIFLPTVGEWKKENDDQVIATYIIALGFEEIVEME